MATATKGKLSGSTDYLPILITATSGLATMIHTATAGTTNQDEIWLFASNQDTSDIELSLLVGTTEIAQTIPARKGDYVIRPGIPLQNQQQIKAFAGTASKIVVEGFINYVTP